LKREVKIMLNKAVESLTLGIELFNRPSDCARTSAVLILIDHSFEMLLKSSIVKRGGNIREKNGTGTIGFDACVRKALSDGSIKFLTEEQALTLQTINALRDAAQHHIIDVSESQLFIHIQSGVTMFKDILRSVFDKDLTNVLPMRVLPISTTPPVTIEALFDNQIEEIRRLLSPGRRKREVAYAKLRPLAILEASIQGKKSQPADVELGRIAKKIECEIGWTSVFPGAASISFSTQGEGPSLELRITKKSGIPIELVKEGTPGTSIVAVKRVDELGFYSLSHAVLAEKAHLTQPKATAMVRYLRIDEQSDSFKLIRIGKSEFKRYSIKAVERIEKALNLMEEGDFDQVWKKFGPGKYIANGA